jgi:uncharacterized protein YrzB (UPF0473 family)
MARMAHQEILETGANDVFVVVDENGKETFFRQLTLYFWILILNWTCTGKPPEWE